MNNSVSDLGRFEDIITNLVWFNNYFCYVECLRFNSLHFMFFIGKNIDTGENIFLMFTILILYKIL